MTDTLRPRDDKDVEDAVRWALAGSRSLEIVGRGSKRGIGRPAQTDLTLDLSGLAGVTLYEPDELVLTARAGTPIGAIESLVASRGQQLAFEPMDCGPLFGGARGGATIGGVIAANLSGPRRLQAGAARDHFLGLKAVSGRGETFKSGGRVVKNVTGYDLCKLMAGSWGTLAALTEVTIKTLPQPETESTVGVVGLEASAAVAVMTAAMGSACAVSGAAHMPATAARTVPQAMSAAGGRSLTTLRLEGVPPSVKHRQAALTALTATFGETVVIAGEQSQALWRAIRDVLPFAASRKGPERPLWRISTAPARGADLAGLVAGRGDCECLYDWAGGLVWVSIGAAATDAGAPAVRDAVAACGGHATLVRAPSAQRAAIAPFEPQPSGLAALIKRVKDGFDPQGVFNTGRMWAGV